MDILIVLCIMGFIIGFVLLWSGIEDQSGWEITIGLTIVISFGITLCCIIASEAKAHGYRSGQIDALNDKIKYEKVEQPNGEVLWQEIESDE